LCSGKHREALAVRGQVQAPWNDDGAGATVEDLRIGPEAWFVRGEGIGLHRNGGGHDPVVGSESFVEQLPAVARPDRVLAAAGGDLPPAGPRGGPTRERPHIHFVASRFVGGITDPAAVRREDGRVLIKRSPKEKFRLARLGVLRIAYVQWQRPEIE